MSGWEGSQPRSCGEHRTLGGRAWCFDCREYCCPGDMGCQGCLLGGRELEDVLAELSAAEAKLDAIHRTVDYWLSNDPKDPRLPQALRQAGQTILAILDGDNQ